MNDLVKETEPGFQPSVFKCRKIDKFQEILVAAIPDPGSHACGRQVSEHSQVHPCLSSGEETRWLRRSQDGV